MRLYLYYALHSLKNQIRKLFKTWVAVFILVCVVGGGLIGVGAGFLAETIENSAPTETTVPADPSGTATSEEPGDVPPDDTEDEEIDFEEVVAIVTLVVSAVTIFIFVLNFLTGEKSGSSIFTLADVNLLFSAPMKPQSVLMFRLMTQIATILVGSVYLVFQLPNLMLNLGLSALQACGALFLWCIIIAYGKLISVFTYTFASSHEGFKKLIRPIVYALVGVVGIGYYITYSRVGSFYTAAKEFFLADAVKYIPVYGWIKQFTVLLMRNDTSAFIYLGLLLLGIVAFVLVIWNIKADFYEDAMMRSAETAEALAAVKSGEKVVAKRKKDRSDKLERDGFRYGSGANVYFFKALYNRFRFSFLKIFSKTSVTYLVLAVGCCLMLRYLVKYESIIVVGLVLGGFAFYRSLGNPVEADIKQDSFIMIPASISSKLLWSLAGGSAICLIDLLPALAVSAVFLKASPLVALGILAFVVSIDFYSACVGMFIDVSVPVSAGDIIKKMVQLIFIYFGLLPVVALLVVGGVMGRLGEFTMYGIALNALIGLAFFGFGSTILEKGRK